MILIGLTASQSRSMTGASCRRHQLVSSLPNNGCSQKRGDVDQTFRGAKVYISQIFYRHPHSTNLEASLRIWPASGVADWVRFAPNPPSAPQHRDTRSTNRNQLRLLESGHRGSFRPSHAFDLLVSGLGRDVRFFGGCEAEEGRGKRDEDMCIRKGVHSFLRDILQVLDLILLKCPSALPCAKQKLMEVAGSITRYIHPLMLFFNSNIKSLERLQLLLPATRTGPLSSSLSLSLLGKICTEADAADRFFWYSKQVPGLPPRGPRGALSSCVLQPRGSTGVAENGAKRATLPTGFAVFRRWVALGLAGGWQGSHSNTGNLKSSRHQKHSPDVSNSRFKDCGQV